MNLHEIASEVAFSCLKKTNKMMIINDKDDVFFHTFYDKYKVCHITLVGSIFESTPYNKSFSVTNLGEYVKATYEDGCLNAPVDVLYVDLGRNFDYLDYLDELIDENTITILKFKQPIVSSLLPSFIKRKYDNYMEDCSRFGDWGKEHRYNASEYFLVFY